MTVNSLRGTAHCSAFQIFHLDGKHTAFTCKNHDSQFKILGDLHCQFQCCNSFHGKSSGFINLSLRMFSGAQKYKFLLSEIYHSIDTFNHIDRIYSKYIFRHCFFFSFAQNILGYIDHILQNVSVMKALYNIEYRYLSFLVRLLIMHIETVLLE